MHFFSMMYPINQTRILADLRSIAAMRKHHTSAFKAQVVRELLNEEKSVAQLAAEYDVHPNQFYRWREIALAGVPRLFSGQSALEQAAKDAAHAQQLEELYGEIGKLTTQFNWLKNKLPQ